jgi:hypothetical protein
MLLVMPLRQHAARQRLLAALLGAALCVPGCTSKDLPDVSGQPSAAPGAPDTCPPQNPDVDGSGDPCRGIQDGSLLCHVLYEDAQALPAEQREAGLANVSAHCSTGTYLP